MQLERYSRRKIQRRAFLESRDLAGVVLSPWGLESHNLRSSRATPGLSGLLQVCFMGCMSRLAGLGWEDCDLLRVRC